MGILRSDRVSGLGGANAINGSAFFPQNTYINVKPDSDLDLSGDFTIEMWVRNLAGPDIAQYQRQLSSTGYYKAGNDGNWYFGFNKQSGNDQIVFFTYDGTGSEEYLTGNCTSNLDQWYHIAASRSGNTLKLFVDGAEEGSGTVSKGLDDGGNNGLFIGGISKNTGTSSWGDHYGWISNLRIIKGTALYTAAFTPPTGRLEQTSDTVLLCCQSPGNVLEEKTGKILSHNNHNTGASKEVSADRLAPDVGEDHGTTFADNTKFDTLSYMVPSGGTTAQRGRGTALFGGGYKTPNSITAIDYLSIQHGGLTQEWGNLSTTQLASGAACSSSTRWVTAGGWTGANNNAIEYVTFTTQGNSLEFGDLVVGRRNTTAVSNSTRGIWGGGYISPADAGTDSIDYITIASTGNAADFGNLSGAAKSGTATGSTTRAVFALGNVAPVDVNTLEYITIATTGNATNFGDLPSGRTGRDNGSCSSNTRGIFAGGQYPTSVNTIDYITIATTGDAVDFGDLTLARGQMGGTSNGTRGVFMGGTTNPARQDTIDSVIIATTGNAVNWGDFRTAKQGLNSAASDSHGGLS